MTARHAATSDSRPGDALVRAGGLLFVVGLLAIAVVVVPSVLTGHPAQRWLVLVAGALPPLGLATALVGLLRAARTTPPTPTTGAERRSSSRN